MKFFEENGPARFVRSARSISLMVLALALVGQAMPVSAQDNPSEARIRSLEGQIRALQRKVFPGGGGKLFGPEIVAPTAATVGAPATSGVGDLASRLESVEAQLRRMTALSEENSNKLALLEAKVNGTSPAPALSPAAAAPTAPTAPVPVPSALPKPARPPAATTLDNNLAVMTGGASAPKSATTPRSGAAASGPSAQRLAAVRAIAKPQTQDPGEDEYSYGFRLWEAKFLPEAEQQLKMMIDRYPRHAKVSYARNLLGRAYLDDGKAREAATWFLQNYQAAKTGDRAPDSLLYLAESMRQLKDINRSCIALAEFATSFPREAAGRLKAQYDATRGGVKCN
jgi:TolA-binding protein